MNFFLKFDALNKQNVSKSFRKNNNTPFSNQSHDLVPVAKCNPGRHVYPAGVEFIGCAFSAGHARVLGQDRESEHGSCVSIRTT